MAEWIADIFNNIGREFAKAGLNQLVSAMNSTTGDIETAAKTTIQSYNGGIFSMMKSINDGVILPVAGVVLTYVAFMELYNIFISRNNMNNIGMEDFFKWILKTSICVLLVSKAFDIVNAFYEVGSMISSKVSGVVHANAVAGNEKPDFSSFVEKLNFGEGLAIGLIAYVAALGMFIIGLISYVYVITWIFECYLMASTSAIPFATLGTGVTSSMGQNYIKNIFALSLQGALFLIIITIYKTLMNGVALNITDMDGVFKALLVIVVPGVVMAILMGKSGQIAKAVIGAA